MCMHSAVVIMSDYGPDTLIMGRRIGRGQFSQVFRARVGVVEVAVKVICFEGMVDQEAGDECLKEVRLLQKLSHVNIIAYLGSYVQDAKLHIVLELADAGDLGGLISRFKKLRRLMHETTIWKYFEQICAAVEHMHSKKIMHRDIKPANVFLTSSGQIKLGDLGLGRFFSSKTVAAHTLVGTPYYMSPERVLEQGYTYKSDIWSLGCLIYELAALQSPFYADRMNLYELIRRIERCRYEPLSSYAYSYQLRSLADACMMAEPSERPDIGEVLETARTMRGREAAVGRFSKG